MSIEISDKAKAQLNNLYENSIKGRHLEYTSHLMDEAVLHLD